MTIPIFLASDDKYASFVAIVIASVCYNTKSFIDFYILDNEISDFNKKRIELLKEKFDNFSIEYIKINLEKYKEFYPTWTDISAHYSRILIPELKPELDKVIYLDVDIIAMGDIKKLYDQDLDGYVVGAIPDAYDTEIGINMSLKKDHIYFNSGVLLMDIKQWKKENITKKVFETEKEFHKKIRMLDQDLLNKTFENNYKKLDFKYNLIDIYRSFTSNDLKNNKQGIEKIQSELKTNIIVRHFAGIKPFLFNQYTYVEAANFNEFWFFAEMTAFYNGLLNSYLTDVIEVQSKIAVKNIVNSGSTPNKTIKIKLFQFIPILKIKVRDNITKVHLFNFIPILKFKK